MNKKTKTQIKGWGLWLLGMLVFCFLGAFVNVVLGWEGIGYGAIIGALWMGCIGRRYGII